MDVVDVVDSVDGMSHSLGSFSLPKRLNGKYPEPLISDAIYDIQIKNLLKKLWPLKGDTMSNLLWYLKQSNNL